MKKATREQPAQALSDAELQELVARAEQGDTSVVSQLRQWLKEHPDVWRKAGDLGWHAEETLLGVAGGNNLLSKESMRLTLDQMRETLLEGSSSPLEELLVQRIVLCWFQCTFCDFRVAANDQKGVFTHPLAQQQQDRAHRRFLSAVKALAQVRKLMARSPSILELLEPVSEHKGESRHQDKITRGRNRAKSVA